MGSILMLCGLAGVLFGILYCGPVLNKPTPAQAGLITNNYAVVLDCDDNMTTAFIYKWGRSADGAPVVELATDDFNVPLTKRVFGGIARFALNATSIYSYLDPLTKWAKSVLPEDADVSIHAKIRDNMLGLSSWERFRLINPINSKLQSTGFRFKGSYVGYLTLKEQAVFGLQSVNSFYGDSELATYGSLTLGRHAISKAYLPMAQAYATDINIGARLHDVSVVSSNHMGAEDIKNKYNLFLLGRANLSRAVDPCLPKGLSENISVVDEKGTQHIFHSVGSGNFQECRDWLSQFFYIPQEQSLESLDKRYVAIDKYNFIKMMFKLDEETSVAMLKQKVEQVCNQTWMTPRHGEHGEYPSSTGRYGGHHAASGGEQGGHHAASGEQGGFHSASGQGGHPSSTGNFDGNWHNGGGGKKEGGEKEGWSGNKEGGEKEGWNGKGGDGARHHGGHHWKDGENRTEHGEGGRHRHCHGGRRNWWLQKCFVGTYTVSVLENMYGFTNDHANDKIIWKDISWTHGYVLSEIAETNSRPPPAPSSSRLTLGENMTGVIVLLVSTALMLVGLILFMLQRRIQYMPLRSEV